jgi:hypothetical protein
MTQEVFSMDFQDLVFSLLSLTITYCHFRAQKAIPFRPFSLFPLPWYYIIYHYCAVINYNQFSSIFIFLLRHCHIITFFSVVLLPATVSLGDWCLVSQDRDVFFSSRVEKSKRNDMDIVSLNDETNVLPHNIWHPSLSDWLPHPRTTEASAAP